MIVPYNFSNYVLGASSVKAFDFIFGTSALLPLVLFFVYTGSTVSSIQSAIQSE